MQVILEQKKYSPFVKKYSAELIKWASYIENSGRDILAISRKGPRLLELMCNEGIMSREVLNRVFTEYAFPFMLNSGKLMIIDDSVLYGTTINNNIARAAEYLGLSNKDIEAVPFKFSIDAPPKIKEVINLEVSNGLLPEDSAHYIGTLISSFKSLGKPYDIEHPIIYVDGDFSDVASLKVKLEAVANAISKTPVVENVNGSFPNSYSILLSGGIEDGSQTTPEFAKIRIYVNQERTRLTIVPISPFVISSRRFDNALCAHSHRQQEIWDLILEASKRVERDEFCSRSLAVFGNYLNSFGLFVKHLPIFDKYFDQSQMQIAKFDLQLLLGFELSEKVWTKLNSFLSAREPEATYQTASDYSAALRDAVLPEEYEAGYVSFLERQSDVLKTLGSEAEIINQIFCAQHHEIEIKSRKNENFLSRNRLKFGVTLRYITAWVEKLLPDYSIKNVHSALDKLIDNGAIVPKYLNLSSAPGETIWGRVFRSCLKNHLGHNRRSIKRIIAI